jgi:uncharacterized protein YkwD
VLCSRIVISFRRRGGALLLGIATGSLLIGGVAFAAPPTVGATSWQALLGAETPAPSSSPSTTSSRPPWRTAAPIAAALPTAAPVAATSAPALPTPEPTPAPTTTPEAVPVRAIVEAPKSAEARSDEPESAAKVSGVAAEVIRETNEERRDAGCGDLAPDSRLASAAQGHASDMAENDYFAHDSEDGTRFDERIRAEGHPSPGGENIAKGQTSAKQVVQEWMDSPGHRRNILNCAFRTIGVGHDDDYWVQDFGR